LTDSIDAYGNHLTDALNEELVYRYCKAIGVAYAEYRTIFIKYKDEETGELIECLATITTIFDGDLIYYRVLRSANSFGKTNDDLVDFSESCNIFPEFNDLLFIDFIFDQQDRHSKVRHRAYSSVQSLWKAV